MTSNTNLSLSRPKVTQQGNYQLDAFLKEIYIVGKAVAIHSLTRFKNTLP